MFTCQTGCILKHHRYQLIQEGKKIKRKKHFTYRPVRKSCIAAMRGSPFLGVTKFALVCIVQEWKKGEVYKDSEDKNDFKSITQFV